MILLKLQLNFFHWINICDKISDESFVLSIELHSKLKRKLKCHSIQKIFCFRVLKFNDRQKGSKLNFNRFLINLCLQFFIRGSHRKSQNKILVMNLQRQISVIELHGFYIPIIIAFITFHWRKTLWDWPIFHEARKLNANKSRVNK